MYIIKHKVCYEKYGERHIVMFPLYIMYPGPGTEALAIDSDSP